MRQITIMAMIDVESALADRSLAGNLYFIDNQRADGSTHEGTEVLRTRARKGDELVWITHSLQVETFVEMADITLCGAPESLEISKQYFRDTDIVIWVGKVKKDLERPLPYKVDFVIGSVPMTLATPRCPSIFSGHWRPDPKPWDLEPSTESPRDSADPDAATEEPKASKQPSAPPSDKKAEKPKKRRTAGRGRGRPHDSFRPGKKKAERLDEDGGATERRPCGRRGQGSLHGQPR